MTLFSSVLLLEYHKNYHGHWYHENYDYFKLLLDKFCFLILLYSIWYPLFEWRYIASILSFNLRPIWILVQ